MPEIFDNLDDQKLGTALKRSLAGFATVDVATGYFDMRGWDSFKDLVEAKRGSGGTGAAGEPVVRLLVGMVAPSDSETILESLQRDVQCAPGDDEQYHDMETAHARKEQLVRHLRNQLMRGLATKRGRATLETLRGQLADGLVQVKVFTEKPLHGKTYIFHKPGDHHTPRFAYVGSSNFTGAGLYSNLELNIEVPDKDATQKLATWFTDRWDDPFSLTITVEIMDLIAASWAGDQPTPFEVYLKVCHELSQDARAGMGYVLPPSMRNLLLPYQETAVRTLARRIVRRGGTMLGDVVGMGKTLTAVATALMLQGAEDYSTLVLCPKNLEGMWTKHLEKYDVNGRVVPYSTAARRLPELKRFNLVICDESHNLRNNTRIDYEAIHQYVRDNNAKVLLLTATPFNLAFEDVANQIGLYLDDDDDLGIEPTVALGKDPGLRAKVDGKTTTLTAFRRSAEAEDWKRLMSDHLVRRTRSFVKRSAKTETVTAPDGTTAEREYLEFAGGQRFHFPTRVPVPLVHEFAEDDVARVMESDETLDAVASLRLPRYRLASYDNPKARHTEQDLAVLGDIRSGRGNVVGFVRTGLFKRLSSSGHSFIVSLTRQRARNDLFLYAIDAGLPLPIGTFTDAQLQFTDLDADSDTEADGPLLHGDMAGRYEQLRHSLPKNTKWINSTVFAPALRADLRRDNDTIETLLDRFGTWDVTRDSKVNRLVDLLRHDHPGEKVLVFSEYVDTAVYVAKALEDAGIGRVGLVSGATADPAAVAKRFSPRSNALPDDADDPAAALAPDDELDVLVATDVLSEGQNLQDAHIVVNYDLPWAIIRIIQRAGRVDRIGQQSDRVYVYLITHDKVEQQINLRMRIKQRLADSAQAFGSDEQFFGSDREVEILEDLYNGKLSDIDEDEGEADAVSEAYLVWSHATERHPAVVRRVLASQDNIGSTRSPRVAETGDLVACFINTRSGVEAFAISAPGPDGVMRERLVTPLEALRVFEAEPDTPAREPLGDFFERVEQLVHGPLTTEAVAEGNLKGTRKRVWERLHGTTGTLFTDQAREALNALHERPLTEHANGRLRTALRNRYSDDDLIDVLNQLHEDDRLVIRTSESDPIKIVCSIGVTPA
ncbi:NgoFVII family restriction endonuclease [Streptomyces venezuelae]|uniref:NgoFVII family restriction endonuclease n=1 Tax=Streptomyces venezuelae TaxID=54571 RepID=A0A5P2DQA9_STRVZ|nr:helicase-related protein [Streptomyces venezuelae]QES55441.1 NgoFVII family restriction endonuclease [Streptomyces venezuelae]